MKTRVLSAVLLAAGMAAAAFAEPDAKAIIAKVDEATKALKGVHYTAESFGEGEMATRRAKLTGEVWIRKTEGSPLIVATKGQATLPSGGEVKKFHIASDGKAIVSIDEDAKVATRGEMPAAMDLVGMAQGLYFQEYNHPTPFSDELNAETAKHEGTKTIGDAECDVIYVTYAGGMGESRWYFAKGDSLPRRVDRIIKNDDDKIVGANVIQITKLEANPKLDDEIFAPKTPTGFEEKKHTPRAAPDEPELLKVGAEAPDWELKTPGGETVSLKSLRGNVVLLDFWATWCGPCKRAMPGIQKLSEHFKGKPVKIIGMNCWERGGGDPAGFMKEKGYTYMLLLKADDAATAYKVSGIPTFYVIGPDGKIVHAAGGFNPDGEKELEEIITKHLPSNDQ